MRTRGLDEFGLSVSFVTTVEIRIAPPSNHIPTIISFHPLLPLTPKPDTNCDLELHLEFEKFLAPKVDH